MRKWVLRACVAAVVMVIGYAAVFGIWWGKRPRTAKSVAGRTVWIVEVDSKTVPFGGQYFWYPGFWTLQSVFRYRCVGFAPQADGDVSFWARNPPDEWLRMLKGHSD